MAAAAHNPEFARKMGIQQKVAKEFNQADAGTGILKANANAHKPRLGLKFGLAKTHGED